MKEAYTYTMPEAFMTDTDVPARWRLLGVLNGFHINGAVFYASNEWLMKRLKCSRRTVTYAIEQLEKLGEITCERTATTRIIHRVVKGSNELHGGVQHNDKEGSNQLHPNSISNNSINKHIAKGAKAPSPYVFEEALKKMEDSPHDYMQLIAYFIKVKKLRLNTREQMTATIKRHVRAAKECVVFERAKVLKAIDDCKAQHDNRGVKWTLETVLKELTK